MAKLSIYHFIADAFNLNVRAQENRDSGLIRCEIVPQSANCKRPCPSGLSAGLAAVLDLGAGRVCRLASLVNGLRTILWVCFPAIVVGVGMLGNSITEVIVATKKRTNWDKLLI